MLFIENKKYYDFIDVGKFFAMFFVLMMHVIADNNCVQFRVVQVGCMAYFFFASGFLLKKEYSQMRLFRFIYKNIISLIVPYLLISFVGYIICLLFPKWYSQYTLNDILYSIFIKGQPICGGLVWFLLCLFEIKLYSFIIWKFVSTISNYKIQNIILFLFVILFCLISIKLYYLYSDKTIDKLPLKIDSSFTGFCFFTLGFIVKNSSIFEKIINKYIYFFIFMFCRIVATFLEIFCLNTTNICDFYFGNSYFLYFLNQIIMIVSYFSFGMCFKDVSLFKNIGKISMYIYLIHWLVIWLVEEIYGRFVGVVKYTFYDTYEIIIISILSYLITVLLSKILYKNRIKLIKC